MDRDRFLARGELERAELLRRVADSIGMTLSDSGTAAALQFMSRGSSGGGIRLTGAGTLERSFDRFVLERDVDSPAEESPGVSRPLVIPSPGAGAGEFVCGGRRYEALWGVGDPEGRRGEGVPAPGMGWEWAGFRGSSLAFPLHLRGWRAGDRTRTAGGGRKLKKLLGERRIAREDRSRLPLLVDAEGLVLWIPGMHLVPGFEGASGGDTTEGRWFVAVRGAAGG
jgi:tRNA(Ile)-lysidine synthetase-like protein